MIAKNIFRTFYLLFLFSWFSACVEPYDMQTEEFESALIIEATITDELTEQQIKLSRTFPLEERGPNPEVGAVVKVMDDLENEFVFQETQPGTYISVSPFRAQPGVNYHLDIRTHDGRSYGSQPVQLSPNTEIESLTSQRIENEDGEEGIALFLESSRTSPGSGYYRYEYEETFKIVSPFSYPFDLVIRNDTLERVPKEREETVCYRTEKSRDILLANTVDFSENRVNGLLVRFIEKGSPKLNHRYSLLVKQFALSREAYFFYETLNELAGSDNLFSQIQPGFLNGNVFSTDNDEAKVLGYFDVSSVSTKRTFFNFSDYFQPGEEGPSFVNYCPIQVKLPSEARAYIISGNMKMIGMEMFAYKMVRTECVDCTLSGTNKVPEFWEE